MAPSQIPAIGTMARIVLFILNTFLCASYGTLVSLPLAAFRSRRLAQWTTGKLYAFMMRKTTGVEFRIIDPHQSLKIRPALFITNHQTELDIVMMCTAMPQWCVVACKSSLKSVPFLGWYLAASGSVFIDKNNSAKARGAMDIVAREILRNNISIFAYPEGTRSHSKVPQLLPFKTGAFRLAVEAKVPIVPLVCGNYSDTYRHKDLKFGSGVIPVTVLKPINTSDLNAADVEELTRSTRELMLDEVMKIAHRKSALVSRVETDIVTQYQESASEEKEHVVVKNSRSGIDASGASVSRKRTLKL